MNLKEPTSSMAQTERASKKPQKNKITIISQKASQVEIRPINWLWLERIARGKLCLIVGNPGVGKSQLTARITATITTGTKFPDESSCTKGKVIFVSAEDDAADTIVPRLVAAGADLEQVHIINHVLQTDESTNKELTFSLATHLPQLEELIIKLTNVAAIIIDPITAYLGQTDTNNNSDVRLILSPLAKIAEKYNLAIICISHNNKNASQQAIHRAIGSIGFIAACRSAYVVVKDNDDDNKRLFLPLKNNNSDDKTGLAFHIESAVIKGNIETSRVVWLNELILKTADEIMSTSSIDHEDKSALEEAEEFLHVLLDSSALPSTEIHQLAKVEAISKSTLRRAKKKMGIIVHREGFGKGSKSMWNLPNTSKTFIDSQK